MHGRYITGGESCSPLVSSLFVVVCGRYMIPYRAGGVGSGRLQHRFFRFFRIQLFVCCSFLLFLLLLLQLFLLPRIFFPEDLIRLIKILPSFFAKIATVGHVSKAASAPDSAVGAGPPPGLDAALRSPPPRGGTSSNVYPMMSQDEILIGSVMIVMPPSHVPPTMLDTMIY